jgi:hypothetical protein
VIGQLAEALAKDYQRTIVIGSASKREPRGILGLATSGLPLADMAQTSTYDNTSNQTKRDSIRKLYYKVNQPHRESPRFVWITNNDGVQTMNSVNDLNQQPFTDAKEGQPPKYIGKTVVETLAIVSATGPESTTLVGGDMGQYAWLEWPGVVERHDRHQDPAARRRGAGDPAGVLLHDRRQLARSWSRSR